MLKIVTDGAADMPASWQQELSIDVIPINIHFGEQTYLQNVDLDNEGFYRLVQETRRIPKTSQPSPFQFSQFYQRIASPGDTILSIHVTSKLSGTFNSAISAAQELAERFKIVPFDSLNGSAGISFMCREARRLEGLGKNVEEIVEALLALREKIHIVLALDTLEYARLNGRVGTLQAVMASLLKVKPIAALRDGTLEIIEKVRTRQASLNRLLERIQEEAAGKPVRLAIVHARDLASGQALLERAKALLNVQDVFLSDLSISIAANLGPGTVGIIYQVMETQP